MLLSHRDLAAGRKAAGCDYSIFSGDLAAEETKVVAKDRSAVAGKEDPAVFLRAALQIRDPEDLYARVAFRDSIVNVVSIRNTVDGKISSRIFRLGKFCGNADYGGVVVDAAGAEVIKAHP